jgi:hypothetical protein
MTRYLLPAALSLSLALGGLAWWLHSRNGALRDDLAAAERSLAVKTRQMEQAQEAAAVLDAHLKRMQGERHSLDAELQRLRQLEGYDAPLSPFLRDAFNRM